MAKAKHPMQPMVHDGKGVVRFKENAIVRDLLDAATDAGIMDLNKIGAANYSREDRVQFAQLIGYSVGGYSELSYVSNKDYAAAESAAESLPKRKSR